MLYFLTYRKLLEKKKWFYYKTLLVQHIKCLPREDIMLSHSVNGEQLSLILKAKKMQWIHEEIKE